MNQKATKMTGTASRRVTALYKGREGREDRLGRDRR